MNVASGTGDFMLTRGGGGGMSGSASGNISIAGASADVQFGGNYSVAVGGGAVKVTGTGDTLTLFGQTLSGNFSFTQAPGAVSLHVNSLNLSLGSGLVMVTGGAADLAITNGAVSGSASGTLSVGGGESGVGFGGTVMAVFGAGGVSVTGTGIEIDIAGQKLTGDVAFSRDTATGILAVGISHMTLSTPAVTVNGQLLVMPSGLSGQLTGTGSIGGVNGTITVSFGNGTFTAAAGVSTQFSENLGPIAVSGKIAAQGSTGGSANVSLTNLQLSLGNGLLVVTGGSATLGYSGGKVSGTAMGMVMLNGVPGLSLGGDVTVTFTPTTIRVAGVSDSITVLGQTLSGDFTFTDNGDGTIGVAVNNLALALANSISLANGSANLTIGGSGASRGVSGTGSGDLALALPGVSFDSTFGLRIDTTGGNSTLVISGSPHLTVGGLTLSGSFTVQKVTTGDGKSTVSLVASNVSTMIGDAQTGVQVSGAGGAILFLPTGVALDLYGSASLIGVTGLTLGGHVHVRLNTTAAAVNETVPAPDLAHPGQTVNQALTLTANEKDVTGTATLAIGDGNGAEFVGLTGGFSFSESQTVVGNVTTTRVLIAAAGLEAFLGDGPARLGDGTINPSAAGVLISNANLGLVVYSTIDRTNVASPRHTSDYALDASGHAALLGVTGLTLSGNLAVRANTAGAVRDTVNVPDPANPGSTTPVTISFTGNEQSFAGTGVTLAIASPSDPTQQFVSLAGDFSFTRTVSGATSRIAVAASNVGAFVGVGGTNPIGLQVAGGSLGLVLVKQGAAAMTYAIAASGNVSLVGIPGLYVGGVLSVQSNTTASQQTNPNDAAHPIPTGGPTANVTGMTVKILDSNNNPVLAISVDATITKTGGLVDINATRAEFTLTANGAQLVDLTGAVDFTVGASGFNLGAAGFQVTGFSILSSGSGAAPNVSTADTSSPAANLTVGGGPGGQTLVHQGVSPSSGSAGQPGSTGSMASVPTPTLPSGTPRKIGPLSLYNLAPVFRNFSFNNGQLLVDLGLKADAAVLTFGSGGSGGSSGSGGASAGGTQAVLTGITGTFQLSVGVDFSSFRITHFGPTGKFSFQANQFVLDVPHVVNVTASNIVIQYDPNADSTQKLISIDSATITVPIGQSGNGIQGMIAPITDANGAHVPGLTIYGDHFQLGRGTIRYLGTLSFSSLAQFTNPFVSIADLSVSFNGSIAFNGSITLGADSVKLGAALSR